MTTMTFDQALVRVEQLEGAVDYLESERQRFKAFQDAVEETPCVNCGRPADAEVPGNPMCGGCIATLGPALRDIAG